MSFATVKKLDSTSVIVTNTVKDAGGGSHVVDLNALDTVATPYLIFAATVALTPVIILEFDLFDNRIFTL